MTQPLSIVALARAPERRTHCRVCGFAEVRTDEVEWTHALLIAECPRCEHRFTQPAPPRPRAQTPAVRVVRRTEVPVPSAA